MNTQCIVGSPEGNHFKVVSNLSHSTTQTVDGIIRVKTMRNNSETDRNKSAQYKVKSRNYKWLLISQKIFYQFLKYARAYLRKGRYAPGLACVF